MGSQHEFFESIFRTVASKNLKRIRQANALSQEQFAALVGISSRAYRNYERGDRSLPGSVRLAVMYNFTEDPVPQDSLWRAPQSPLPPLEAPPIASPLSIWLRLAEVQRKHAAYRSENRSKTAQLLLDLRDQAFVVATLYFALKKLAVSLSLPFGMEVNGTDYAYLGSFVVIMLLFFSVIQDLPFVELAKNLPSRSRQTRRDISG